MWPITRKRHDPGKKNYHELCYRLPLHCLTGCSHTVLSGSFPSVPSRRACHLRYGQPHRAAGCRNSTLGHQCRFDCLAAVRRPGWQSVLVPWFLVWTRKCCPVLRCVMVIVGIGAMPKQTSSYWVKLIHGSLLKRGKEFAKRGDEPRASAATALAERIQDRLGERLA